jgi:hypothetical protein
VRRDWQSLYFYVRDAAFENMLVSVNIELDVESGLRDEVKDIAVVSDVDGDKNIFRPVSARKADKPHFRHFKRHKIGRILCENPGKKRKKKDEKDENF